MGEVDHVRSGPGGAVKNNIRPTGVDVELSMHVVQYSSNLDDDDGHPALAGDGVP